MTSSNVGPLENPDAGQASETMKGCPPNIRVDEKILDLFRQQANPGVRYCLGETNSETDCANHFPRYSNHVLKRRKRQYFSSIY